MSEVSEIHVAVGVLVNDASEVLVALRSADRHQGGFWEFPGGKLEPGETLQQGLEREFREEIGIQIHRAFPLCRISHDYGDKAVLLDVCRIQGFDGEPRGLEGQPLEWRPVSQLKPQDFPAANAPIIKALQLPQTMAITPPMHDWEQLEQYLRVVLGRAPGLIQLRQKQLPKHQYLDWYHRALELCHGHNVPLLFNHDTAPLPDSGLPGVHVSSRRLHELQSRPVPATQLFSASCHDAVELQRAAELGADFVTLSPVLPTPKYPDGPVLGWQRFTELRHTVSLPVYALGGMSQDLLASARSFGADGIAGMRLFAHK